MGETSLQKNTQLIVDEPMFQPFPSEIFFQKFEPFNVYEIPLLLRNNDKVSATLKDFNEIKQKLINNHNQKNNNFLFGNISKLQILFEMN